MEKRVHAGLLLSFYGKMLTERQREWLRLYYEDDLSLSEIAETSGVTRQAAHDAIRRGERQLEALEARLGLASRWVRICAGLETCRTALRAGDTAGAERIVEELLRQEEEQDGV